MTEVLYSIGAQDRLVGVTDFCDYPAEARRKPRVGGMLAPSLEGIVSLKPDLVVATTAGNRHETFEQLERLGIPVYVVNPVSVADVLDLLARLGQLDRAEPGRGPRGGGPAGADHAVTARVEARKRPRVLYVLWPDPLIVPGRGSLVSELIGLAGGESVTADGGQGYPRYSLEAALARNPEVIILASHGSEQSPLVRAQWERFGQVPASRRAPLHDDGDLTHRYGPRMVDGLEQLARLIHPEAFDRARPMTEPPRVPRPARPPARGLGLLVVVAGLGALFLGSARVPPATCWPCSPAAQG